MASDHSHNEQVVSQLWLILTDRSDATGFWRVHLTRWQDVGHVVWFTDSSGTAYFRDGSERSFELSRIAECADPFDAVEVSIKEAKRLERRDERAAKQKEVL
jgi:hypothetical protein